MMDRLQMDEAESQPYVGSGELAEPVDLSESEQYEARLAPEFDNEEVEAPPYDLFLDEEDTAEIEESSDRISGLSDEDFARYADLSGSVRQLERVSAEESEHMRAADAALSDEEEEVPDELRESTELESEETLFEEGSVEEETTSEEEPADEENVYEEEAPEVGYEPYLTDPVGLSETPEPGSPQFADAGGDEDLTRRDVAEPGEIIRTWSLAGNVSSNLRTVLSTRWMRNLGTLGDTRHQAGSGDHTPWSTHTGKYGYPTQGQVHAQDIGMVDSNLLKFESWIRGEWRAGRAFGVKYINVLNRHWNLQNWTNANAARAGSLRPRYSSDHHLHVSYENGTRDGDLMARYIAWLAGKTVKPVPPVSLKVVGPGPNGTWPVAGLTTDIRKVPADKLEQLCRGTGGPGSPGSSAVVDYFVYMMKRFNPGYWQMAKNLGTRVETTHEVDTALLTAIAAMAKAQGVPWRGCVTAQVWDLYQPHSWGSTTG